MDDSANAMATPPDQVGPRLRQRRAQRGVTPTALPEATGIPKTTLSRRETSRLRASLELRLVLGDEDLVLGAGEAAEFDTRVPHWFGSTGEQPAEILSMFGPQGERVHARGGTTGTRAPAK